MPLRSKEHILETIAARAFEKLLHPSSVANPVNQGKDYGIDYRVQTFDDDGHLWGGFDVQVKHVPHSEKACSFGTFPHYPGSSSVSYIGYAISLEHLAVYLNPKVTTNPTLLVLANDRECFFHWVNDLEEYYLRWLPKSSQQTRTVYFCDIRSFPRKITTNHSSQVVWPARSEYKDGKDTFWAHSLSTCGEGWLTRWIAPKTVDSLTNLGFCMYVQNSVPRTRVVDGFDAQGFFDFLIAEEHQRPWIFTAFAHFFSTITPSESMSRWALAQLKEWKNGFRIPAAYQILSQVNEADKPGDALLEIIDIRRRNEILAFEDLFDDVDVSPRSRFLADYIWAKASFLATHAKNGNFCFQEALVIEMLNFDYSFGEPNVYVTKLISLLKGRVRFSERSLGTLLRALETSPDATTDLIVEGITSWNSRQLDERRRG